TEQSRSVPDLALLLFEGVRSGTRRWRGTGTSIQAAEGNRAGTEAHNARTRARRAVRLKYGGCAGTWVLRASGQGLASRVRRRSSQPRASPMTIISGLTAFCTAPNRACPAWSSSPAASWMLVGVHGWMSGLYLLLRLLTVCRAPSGVRLAVFTPCTRWLR